MMIVTECGPDDRVMIDGVMGKRVRWLSYGSDGTPECLSTLMRADVIEVPFCANHSSSGYDLMMKLCPADEWDVKVYHSPPGDFAKFDEIGIVAVEK